MTYAEKTSSIHKINNSRDEIKTKIQSYMLWLCPQMKMLYGVGSMTAITVTVCHTVCGGVLPHSA